MSLKIKITGEKILSVIVTFYFSRDIQILDRVTSLNIFLDQLNAKMFLNPKYYSTEHTTVKENVPLLRNFTISIKYRIIIP